ncbi:MAG: HNH endonuclease [Phycisphaerae bacterium]
MSLSSIPKALRLKVAERDQLRCQYCHLTQVGQAAIFHVDHVIPRSAGGVTSELNLVLQCPHCSLHKSNKTSAKDPETGGESQLFHPLTQRWVEHFMLDGSGFCRGRTPVGRATVEALEMNAAFPRIARSIQIRLGLLHPSHQN